MLAAIDDAVGGAFGDGLSQYDFDADAFQRGLRIGREIVGKARQHARAGFDQHHARLMGIDVAKIRRQRVLREFGDGAGKFDAGRAGADDDKGQKCGALFRIAFAFGSLEGDQDSPPQRGGVFERFQTRRKRLPFVVAEIGMSRAGREHQRVVGQRIAVVEQHAFIVGVDAADGGEQGRDFASIVHQMANWPGDLGGSERGGRDLVQ